MIGDLVGYLFVLYGVVGLGWCMMQFVALRKMRKNEADL